MSIDSKSSKDRDAPEPAQSAQAPSPPQSLGLESAPGKAAEEPRGFNPYDTTGGFDRKKNWAQVRKR